jgi:hypothetical protein
MAVLSLTVAGFLGALERQDRKLDLLLERTGRARDALTKGSTAPGK